MSQSLRSMSEEAQKLAIARRLKENSGGLGYLSAMDAQAKKAEKAAEKAAKK